MAAPSLLPGRAGAGEPSYRDELVELVRLIVTAGIPVGVVVAGLGSRLAMLLLRVTSPDSVRGVTSDDGFTIGQVTLGGTYNLFVIGAAVGVIGAAAYIAVAPWLVGPTWLRRTTVGLTAGVVVGSLLVHADGVDFVLLTPRWLAIGLFVALPVVMGVALAIALERAARPDAWAAQGSRRLVVPLVLTLVFLPSLPVTLVVALIVAVLLPVRRALLRPLQESAIGTFVVRALFLTVPLGGSIALGQDLTALY
ncbi:MAG: hypothetical protein WAK18_02890 [Nocardioidaceae bacterium]